MDVNNRGRAHPAGVVAGAWLVGLVLQTGESGSVLRLESGRKPGGVPVWTLTIGNAVDLNAGILGTKHAEYREAVPGGPDQVAG